jgi:hypothetical protein
VDGAVESLIMEESLGWCAALDRESCPRCASHVLALARLI